MQQPTAGFKGEPESDEALSLGCSMSIAAALTLPFFLAGVGIFYLFYLGPVLKVRAAKSWQATPCLITSSKVVSRTIGGRRVDDFQFGFSYAVNGNPYQSERYSFTPVYLWSWQRETIVRQHSAGNSAMCYVNPDDPAEAVLNRDYLENKWLGLAGLWPVLLSGSLFYFMVRRNSRKNKSREEQRTNTNVLPTDPT